MPEDSGSRYKSPAYCPMFEKLINSDSFRQILLKLCPINVQMIGSIFQTKEIIQRNQKSFFFLFIHIKLNTIYALIIDEPNNGGGEERGVSFLNRIQSVVRLSRVSDEALSRGLKNVYLGYKQAQKILLIFHLKFNYFPVFEPILNRL